MDSLKNISLHRARGFGYSQGKHLLGLSQHIVPRFLSTPLLLKSGDADQQAKKLMLQSWINKHMKIEMTDGRVLIGMFLCTDRDGNVILGSCSEYLNPEVCGFSDEPRLLGLVMVPGRHIVTIHFNHQPQEKDVT